MHSIDDEEVPHNELFEVMHSFRKLNISSILPNITHAEFGMLNIIYLEGKNTSENGLKVSELVTHMRIAPPAVSRMLKSLEERDCIIRTADKKDRRNTYVRLTAKGTAVLTEAKQIMLKFTNAVFDEMGEENMTRLISYLKSLQTVASEEIERLKYRE